MSVLLDAEDNLPAFRTSYCHRRPRPVSPDNLKSASARTAECERSHPGLRHHVSSAYQKGTLTFLDEVSRQIRLRDISETCATIRVDGRPQRKKQALELLKALHVLQPKLKERVVQFLLRLLPFDPRSSSLPSFEDLGVSDRAVLLTFP